MKKVNSSNEIVANNTKPVQQEQPKQQSILITFTEEQLNALINKSTNNVLETLSKSGVFDRKANDDSPLKQLTLKDFVKLNYNDNAVELGKLLVNAFMNADINSVLYQEMYDFFFKYRIGETLIRYTMELGKSYNDMYDESNANTYCMDVLRTCVSLTDMTFERIGMIVVEQFKLDKVANDNEFDDYQY